MKKSIFLVLMLILEVFHLKLAESSKSVDHPASASGESKDKQTPSWNPACVSEFMGHFYVFGSLMMITRLGLMCSLIKLFVATRSRMKTKKFVPFPRQEKLRKIGFFILISFFTKITIDCRATDLTVQNAPPLPASETVFKFLTDISEFVYSFRIFLLGLILFGMIKLILTLFHNLRYWRPTSFLLVQFFMLCVCIGIMDNYFSQINNRQYINCMNDGSRLDAFWDVCPMKSVWNVVVVIFCSIVFW